MGRRAGMLLVVGLLAVVVGWGCEKEEEPPKLETGVGEHIGMTESGERKPERDLAQAEFDTLRSWRKQLQLTRDEYWDDHGGVVGNAWAEVWYAPGKRTVLHAMAAFMHFKGARERGIEVFQAVPSERLRIQCSVSMDAFSEMTGLEWWRYSLLKNNEIIMQPIPVLSQRGLMDIAPGDGYYRWAIRRLSADMAPRWVEHGLASVLTGELGVLTGQIGEFRKNPILQSLEDTDKALRGRKDKQAYRVAAYNACRSVGAIVERWDERALGAVIVAVGEGRTLDEAAREHMRASWEEVTATALSWQEGWER